MSSTTFFSLSAPAVERELHHTRRIHYQGFKRTDGLWDMEGELIDTKAIDVLLLNGHTQPAGEPVHHMQMRVTVDERLVVHAIEVAMPSHPLNSCPLALAAMQRMVGACMAKGWRQAIDSNLGSVRGCAHLRELLMNMATATFQTILSAFTPAPGKAPLFLDGCTAWDTSGAEVEQFFPQFAQMKKSKAHGKAH